MHLETVVKQLIPTIWDTQNGNVWTLFRLQKVQLTHYWSKIYALVDQKSGTLPFSQTNQIETAGVCVQWGRWGGSHCFLLRSHLCLVVFLSFFHGW